MHTNTRAPRALGRVAAIGATALAALGLTLTAASPALAHDELVGQSFTADEQGATDALVLHYNNDIMDVGTEIIVVDGLGADATAGAPQVAGRDVTQPLQAPLEPGGYEVAWRVVSSDGHPIQGELHFEVGDDGSAAIVDAPAEHAHDEDGHDEDQHSHETDEGASGGAEAAADETAANGEAPAEDEGGSGMPIGAWIAIGIALAVALGVGPFAAKRARGGRSDGDTGTGTSTATGSDEEGEK